MRPRPRGGWPRTATPRTAGCGSRRARPEAVALLNRRRAAEFAADAPAGTPPALGHQPGPQRRAPVPAARLGYAAVLPSAHCLGFAADVEMAWFRPVRRPRRPGRSCCSDRQRGRDINVIDEGQAWHVCVSPARGDALRRDLRRRPGRSERDVRHRAESSAPEARTRRSFRRMLAVAPAPRGDVEEILLDERPARRHPAAADRRPGARGPAVALGRRALAALLQRRGLQPPRAAGRADRPGPPVPHRRRHRGACWRPSSQWGEAGGAPAARRVRLRDRRAGHRPDLPGPRPARGEAALLVPPAGCLHLASEVKALVAGRRPDRPRCRPATTAGPSPTRRRTWCPYLDLLAPRRRPADPIDDPDEAARLGPGRAQRQHPGAGGHRPDRSAVVLSGGLDSSLTLLHVARDAPRLRRVHRRQRRTARTCTYARRLTARPRRARTR